MTEPRRRRASSCTGCNNQLLLGEIKGTVTAVLENQKTQGAQLTSMDSRLRSVENKGAIAGAVSGLLMAVGVNLAGWWLKGKS
jgi:hypothetical protein